LKLQGRKNTTEKTKRPIRVVISNNRGTVWGAQRFDNLVHSERKKESAKVPEARSKSMGDEAQRSFRSLKSTSDGGTKERGGRKLHKR